MGRVSDGRIVRSQVVADPANHDETGVEAETEVELHVLLLLEP
jgi:hypothetical protein